MRISLVGINHQTAPVTVREKVAVGPGKLHDALLMLRHNISEGIILSTCNRTEVYTVDSNIKHAEKAGQDFLIARVGTKDSALLQCVYLLRDRMAVEHLFRVVSGLESMIVGEYEVLGQVGHALEAAEEAGMVNLPLRHVFQSAIRTGRRVREETGISRNAVSVSSAAVALSARAVGQLARCKMLVIGTGEAGRLVAQAAKDRGISRTVVVGRTLERARLLAGQLGGTPVSISNLDEELADADIVISCSGAPHYTLNVGQVKRAMTGRPKLPLVIIDIAVPRNIEPSVGRIDNVFLYNIDNITELSNENLKQREQEITGVERIVAEELASFSSWWHEFEVRPLIRAMVSRAEEIRRFHLERTMKKLPALNEEDKHRLEMMTRAIVNKILRDPIRNLKVNGNEEHDYAELVKQLFHLEVKDSPRR